MRARDLSPADKPLHIPCCERNVRCVGHCREACEDCGFCAAHCPCEWPTCDSCDGRSDELAEVKVYGLEGWLCPTCRGVDD